MWISFSYCSDNKSGNPGEILSFRGPNTAVGSTFKIIFMGKNLKLRRSYLFPLKLRNYGAVQLSIEIMEVSVFFTDGWQHWVTFLTEKLTCQTYRRACRLRRRPRSLRPGRWRRRGPTAGWGVPRGAACPRYGWSPSHWGRLWSAETTRKIG